MTPRDMARRAKYVERLLLDEEAAKAPVAVRPKPEAKPEPKPVAEPKPFTGPAVDRPKGK